MDAIEQTYCRAPLARSFNQFPFTRWISSINISFSEKFGRENAFTATTDYEPGYPDGAAIRFGKIIYVECKAAFGSFLFSKWSAKQRKWYEYNCNRTKTPYYVGIFLSSERGAEGSIYLVPSNILISGNHKSMTCKQAPHLWSSYKLFRGANGLLSISEKLWRP